MSRPAGAADLVVGRWGARFLGRAFACSIGRGGIRADKREGDGASPAGAWRMRAVLYRADRRPPPVTNLPVFPIGPREVWIDDPGHPLYNLPARWLWPDVSHERLRRPDPLYDLVVVTDHNACPPLPGLGSAIFIHAWRRPRFPTAGCAAFAPADLEWIVARLHAESRLIFR